MAAGGRAAGSLERLSEIAHVAARHGFGYVLGRKRFGGLIGRDGRRDDEDSASDRGRRLRELLEELGPTFVKFGQLLSTRPDVVPPDVAAELRRLQDEVAPVAFEEVRSVVEADLDLTLEQAFLSFEETPVASASIGQVHRAVLPDGQRVAVKVQRPGAREQIESDLALLYQAARLLRERVRALEFMDPREVVGEFARSVRLELDYRHEARNAEVFRRNFASDEGVVVPRVVRSYSTSRVLTLEYLDGTKVADLDLEALPPAERRDIAYRMADAWMTMVFRHGFFHSDPHPANIFVLPAGALGLVDFGQAGKLTDEDMARATRLFVDAATENVDAIPRRLRELGVRYAPEREEELRAELQALFDRYYGARLSDIDPLQVIREAFQLIYSLNLKLPSRFVMLDKAIATLASVTQEVYPELNVFAVARPYARALMADRYQPRVLASRTRAEVVALASRARDLPFQVSDVLDRLRDGTFQVRVENPGIDEIDAHLDQASNRLAVALVVAGGLVGSAIIGVFADEGPRIVGLHVLSFLGFVLSGAFGLWLVWGIARHGRL
ncbi:MAG: AarF/UbiB family protein [Thermoleophilia bacterium]|nr:AarF/UbiB family protein [Gaiellaceae bacterium]MDW8338490.1 AarF/UbiB family protein [Thermoleophilia bacterium]